MTEDEKRRRISQVYDLLLRLAEEAKAGGVEVGDPPATDTQGEEPRDTVYYNPIYRKTQEEAGSEDADLMAF